MTAFVLFAVLKTLIITLRLLGTIQAKIKMTRVIPIPEMIIQARQSKMLLKFLKLE